MFDELVKLESAITDFDRQADDDFVDPRRLSAAIDRLQGTLCRAVAAAKKRNQHLLSGQSGCSWVARECHISKHAVDAEGFSAKVEDDFERRQLFISESGGMYRLDAWLDPVGGTTLKAAIDSMSNPLGADDRRTAKQRRADALVEAMHHAMGAGTLPRRNGVRPHISINTTIEGLKGELGAPASELQGGMPISSKTVQRLACDGTLHRVLKAGSVVVDVGRATRRVSLSQWRALRARHRTCAAPECDRPVNMTSPHHIEFWAHGGRSDLPHLLPLGGLLPKGSYAASGVGF